MLKFILFVIVLFLLMRLALRLLGGGLFFFNKKSTNHSRNSSSPFSSGEHVEEADFEVIESHLSQHKDDVE